MKKIFTLTRTHSKECSIFCIAFAMHFLFFILFFVMRKSGFWLQPQDAEEYATLAKNLIQYKAFIAYSGIMPESWFTPGYPVFLAIFYYFFHSWLPIVIIQNILASCSAVLIYILGKKYFSERTGYIAALLFALEPTNAYISNFLWSEALFLFLFLGFIYFLMDFLLAKEFSKQKNGAVIAGLLLAMAIYVRQIAFFMPVLVLALLIGIGFFMRQYITRMRIKTAFLFFLIVAGLITPYLVRNKLLFDSWAIGGGGVVTLYFVDAVPFAYMRTASSPIMYLIGLEEPMRPDGNIPLTKLPEKLHYRDQGGLYYASYLTNAAKKIILPHPFQYVTFHLASGFGGFIFQDTWQYILRRVGYGEPGIARALVEHNFEKIKQQTDPQKIIWFIVTMTGHILYPLISVLAIIGTVRITRYASHKKILFAVLCFLVYCYFATLTGGQAYRERYRYPATPFLFFLAVEGGLYVQNFMRAKRL